MSGSRLEVTGFGLCVNDQTLLHVIFISQFSQIFVIV